MLHLPWFYAIMSTKGLCRECKEDMLGNAYHKMISSYQIISQYFELISYSWYQTHSPDYKTGFIFSLGAIEAE